MKCPEFGPPDVPAIPELPDPVQARQVVAAVVFGFVLATLIYVSSQRRRLHRHGVIFLPSFPVYRHCACGYPAKTHADLVDHLNDMHPYMAPEVKFDILHPERHEGTD